MTRTLMDAPDVLKRIAGYKSDEVKALKQNTSLEALRERAAKQKPPRGFETSIRGANGPALICEVKKASPSKGVIREDFDPVEIAKSYEIGGATCLSVLTDTPGFQGSNEIFAQVRAATELPILRKDFMLEPIQIAESAALGADCVLIILAMIGDKTAAALIQEAKNLGLDFLIETHTETELKRAIQLGGSLIGINNRDLRNFETSLDTFDKLAELTPRTCTLIAESGIFTTDDILRLATKGAQGYLIGESLMRQDDVTKATKHLSGA